MLLGCRTAPCIAPPVARLPESAYCDICFGLESWMSLVERAKISDVFPEGLCWWRVSRNMLRNSAERGNSPPCSPRVPGEQLWRGCSGVLEELLDHLLRAAQASTSLAASVCPSCHRRAELFTQRPHGAAQTKVGATQRLRGQLL